MDDKNPASSPFTKRETMTPPFSKGRTGGI
jgi:hypothetical protein